MSVLFVLKSAMSVDVVVAYARWAEGRREALGRLLRSMGDAGAPMIVASTEREPPFVWALRLWRYMAGIGGSHIVFLNDDVTVCPRFVEACEAIARALPDEVVSLHTTAREAEPCANAWGVSSTWLRSYWVTGPGYMVPRARLDSLLRFAEERADYFAHTNEDNFMMQWLWSEQRPAWHCVPALVKHDASVPSTYGFDEHPDRTSSVTWERWPHAPLTDAEFWKVEDRDAVPFVECPWLPIHALRTLEAMHHAGVDWVSMLAGARS